MLTGTEETAAAANNPAAALRTYPLEPTYQAKVRQHTTLQAGIIGEFETALGELGQSRKQITIFCIDQIGPNIDGCAFPSLSGSPAERPKNHLRRRGVHKPRVSGFEGIGKVPLGNRDVELGERG